MEGGDPAPLLCPGETPPVTLHPALRSLAQKDMDGPVTVGPKEGHRNHQRDGAPSFVGERPRDLRLFNLEKTPGTTHCIVSLFEWDLEKGQLVFLPRSVVTAQGEMALKRKRVVLDYILGKNSLF